MNSSTHSNTNSTPKSTLNSMDDVTERMTSMSVNTSSGTTESKNSFHYCHDETTYKKFHDHITSYTQTSGKTIYVDCEGPNLGREDGLLVLIQVGVEKEVYLIDVIAYPESLTTLKGILEDDKIDKVMWDCRSDAAEMWFGHGITLTSVIDAQLIEVNRDRTYADQVYGRRWWEPRRRVTLSGMAPTFERSNKTVHLDSGINMERFFEVRKIVRAKFKEANCWISRPLENVMLEYAAFDIMQLRSLYAHYQVRENYNPSSETRGDIFSRYPHIRAESNRYVELFRHRVGRRPRYCVFFDHGFLPQEILERTGTEKCVFDWHGTMDCMHCERELHRESFIPRYVEEPESWPGDREVCFTCSEAAHAEYERCMRRRV